MPLTYTVGTGAVLQVSIVGRQFAQEVMIVRHYRLNLIGGGTDIDGPAAIDDFMVEQVEGAAGNLATDIMPALSSNVVNIVWRFQWIHPTRYAFVTRVPTLTEGTGPASCEPPGVAVAITLKAVTTGRHSRGTVHMPGVPVSFNANGLITAAAFTIYDNAGGAFRRRLNNLAATAEFYPIIYYRALPDLSQDVVERNVEQTVRTMRRRVVGRGT